MNRFVLMGHDKEGPTVKTYVRHFTKLGWCRLFTREKLQSISSFTKDKYIAVKKDKRKSIGTYATHSHRHISIASLSQWVVDSI